MMTEAEDESDEPEGPIEPWQPREVKPFYWLIEVAEFLGVSRSNAYFKLRRGDIRAKRFTQGARHGWIVMHAEMVRYMEEGSWRLSKFPIVGDQASVPRDPSPSPSRFDSIPDPPNQRQREREEREQRLRAIPPDSREALRKLIRGGQAAETRA